METAPELSRQLRRADDFIKLGVQAGYATIREVKGKDFLPADSLGLFLGTAFGTMETNFAVLNQVVTEEPPSPILFSHSVFNAAAGYIATIFDIQGCALTITDFVFPFFRALEQGYLAVLTGRLDYCLVLQIETYSTLLNDANKKSGSADETWCPGAVCWLLGKTDPDSSVNYQIESLKIESGLEEPDSCLKFKEQVWINGTSSLCTNPLCAATLLTQKMKTSGITDRLDCRIDAQYGAVELRFNRMNQCLTSAILSEKIRN